MWYCSSYQFYQDNLPGKKELDGKTGGVPSNVANIVAGRNRTNVLNNYTKNNQSVNFNKKPLILVMLQCYLLLQRFILFNITHLYYFNTPIEHTEYHVLFKT